MKSPIVIFPVSFIVLWLSAHLGASLRTRRQLQADEREDFGTILGATLTLLALIIGFSFSMAIDRYDQRKNYEEIEANAIGTEYARADLLPTVEAVRVRALLRKYLNQRVLFYITREDRRLQQIAAETAQLQAELWSAVLPPAPAQPTAVTALAVSGMNDVLNSQGSTQASMWNRIPTGAWSLMIAIAIFCNLLFGYGARSAKAAALLFIVVPLVVSISFFLIADIDSPRRGVIRVHPENLLSLCQSLDANRSTSR